METMHIQNRNISVTVVVATYKRPATLRKLFDSLLEAAIDDVIVVDNASDPETKRITSQSPLRIRYVDPGTNLSCGGGVKRGLQEGLLNSATTHFWLFDDDAAAQPFALKSLLQSMHVAEADIAVPIILDEHGNIGWFPGLLEKQPWKFLKRNKNIKHKDYSDACGLGAVSFSWAPWPSLLVTRRAIESVGFPRDDFWLMAEDIEFTLRLTAKFKGIFVPTATCGHYPPESGKSGERAHYSKFCLMLQNLSYISIRLPHARRCLKHLPANYVRFLRTFGISKITLFDATRAFWWGGLLGKPAGKLGYQKFREQWISLATSSENTSKT